jgi:spore maturation protein A
VLNHIFAFLVVVGILVALSSSLYHAQRGEAVVKVVGGREMVELRPYATWGEKLKAIAAAGDKITQSAINTAGFRYEDPQTKQEKSGAVGLAIDYIGIMALWLGFMKIAEAAGLIQLLARGIAPVFRFLFPRVPVDHPAAGAMLMNMAANVLGLDNAATPLGIKAMKELQELNGQKDTASNAMCMFLALNTSSLTLLPVSVIGWRVASHSAAPASVIVPILIATSCGKIAAIVACKLLERLSPDTPSTLEDHEASAAPSSEDADR